MLDKNIVEEKIKERGFVTYASIGKTKIQFISEHMYQHQENKEKASWRDKKPTINIIVDLEKDEFTCIYNINNSFNTLNCPSCGSVLNNDHFDRIVCEFELQAKWLERLR
jgi:hypothetical protein